MTSRRVRGSLVCLFVPFVFLGAGPAVTAVAAPGIVYYVATSGSDSSPGTLAQPWRTIQKAAATAVAGDTVTIRAGTYNEQVVPLSSGSAGSPIQYTS
jgi:hypothetical protein